MSFGGFDTLDYDDLEDDYYDQTEIEQTLNEMKNPGQSNFSFDQAEDPFSDLTYYRNAYVKVADSKAEYISNGLYDFLEDSDVLEVSNTNLEFLGLDENIINGVVDDLSKLAKPGRFKQDFFVPFPSSPRISERDFFQEISLAHEKYIPFESSYKANRDFISMSDLDKMGLGLPNKENSKQEIGSAKLGEIEHLFHAYSDFMVSEDEQKSNYDYLYDISRMDSPLADHEGLSISCYKPVIQSISKTRLSNYTLFLRRLAENILHSSRKVKKGTVQMRTLGDARILMLQTHSNLTDSESGPLCSFIIYMSPDDYELYSKICKIKNLFLTTKGYYMVFIPWRSFDLIDCSIMLKSNYFLLVFPLLFVDSLTQEFDFKLGNIMKLLTGLIQCRNSEIFSIISSFRYIMPGVLNKFHNISSLIKDKFPKRIRSLSLITCSRTYWFG